MSNILDQLNEPQREAVTTENGRSLIEFCDTDQQDYPYIVQINGLTRDGRPFTATHTIENTDN